MVVRGAKARASPDALSEESIVRAAHAIIRESGVAGLTMRRLSDCLGVALGATYHYVPNRQALMRLLVNDIVQELELPEGDDGDANWVEELRVALTAYIQLMARYPGLAGEMVLDLENTMPVVFHDWVVRRLLAAGFDKARIESVLVLLFFFMAGVTVSGPLAMAAAPADHSRFDDFVDTSLRMLLRGLEVELQLGRTSNGDDTAFR